MWWRLWRTKKLSDNIRGCLICCWDSSFDYIFCWWVTFRNSATNLTTWSISRWPRGQPGSQPPLSKEYPNSSTSRRYWDSGRRHSTATAESKSRRGEKTRIKMPMRRRRSMWLWFRVTTEKKCRSSFSKKALHCDKTSKFTVLDSIYITLRHVSSLSSFASSSRAQPIPGSPPSRIQIIQISLPGLQTPCRLPGSRARRCLVRLSPWWRQPMKFPELRQSCNWRCRTCPRVNWVENSFRSRLFWGGYLWWMHFSLFKFYLPGIAVSDAMCFSVGRGGRCMVPPLPVVILDRCEAAGPLVLYRAGKCCWCLTTFRCNLCRRSGGIVTTVSRW